MSRIGPNALAGVVMPQHPGQKIGRCVIHVKFYVRQRYYLLLILITSMKTYAKNIMRKLTGKVLQNIILTPIGLQIQGVLSVEFVRSFLGTIFAE